MSSLFGSFTGSGDQPPPQTQSEDGDDFNDSPFQTFFGNGGGRLAQHPPHQDGMNQDDTMSGAMPTSSNIATQQPTMSGALLDASSEPSAAHSNPNVARGEEKRRMSASYPHLGLGLESADSERDLVLDDDAAPKAPMEVETEVIEEVIETVEATGGDDEPIVGDVTAAELIEEPDHNSNAIGSERAASVELGHERPSIHVTEETSTVISPTKGDVAAIVETHAEIVEEPVEEPVPETADDSSNSAPSVISAETPLRQQSFTPERDTATSLAAHSAPPKRKAAHVGTNGERKRRRTAADMLRESTNEVIKGDYSDRSKRHVSPKTVPAATPVQAKSARKGRPSKTASAATPKTKATRKSNGPVTTGEKAMPKLAAKARASLSTPHTPATEPKRRGRPPKSANATPATTSAETAIPASAPPKRVGRPSKSSNSTPIARDTDLTRTPAATTVTPKRGRPVKSATGCSPLKRPITARTSAPKVEKIEKDTPKVTPKSAKKTEAKAESTPAEPPKRRGRPPKNPQSEASEPEVAPAKKPLGRPAATKSEPAPKRGRAAKVEPEPASTKPRGRAAATAEPADSVAEPPKRRGRPPKAATAATISTAAKRTRAASPAPEPPAKKAKAEPAPAPKKKAGRPPKAAAKSAPAEEEEPAPKPRGRPKKTDSAPAAGKKTPVKKAGKGAIKADKGEKPSKGKTAGGRVTKAVPTKPAATTARTRSLRNRE